jgi:hypothetical protein
MSADPSQTIPAFSPARSDPARRRRRRHSHRGLKRATSTRRVQRALALVFLGLVVILASLYFAQRFAAYEPPPVVLD